MPGFKRASEAFQDSSDDGEVQKSNPKSKKTKIDSKSKGSAKPKKEIDLKNPKTTKEIGTLIKKMFVVKKNQLSYVQPGYEINLKPEQFHSWFKTEENAVQFREQKKIIEIFGKLNRKTKVHQNWGGFDDECEWTPTKIDIFYDQQNEKASIWIKVCDVNFSSDYDFGKCCSYKEL